MDTENMRVHKVHDIFEGGSIPSGFATAVEIYEEVVYRAGLADLIR
jgi:hypothetical protein